MRAHTRTRTHRSTDVPAHTPQLTRTYAHTTQITAIRDLTDGYDSTTPDKKPLLPLNIGGEMITYTFEVGATITLRTSGTEPKLKFYCEMKVCAGNPNKHLNYLVSMALLRMIWHSCLSLRVVPYLSLIHI